MPKKIVMKYKEYVPNSLINASFLDDTAKDVLGWLIALDATDVIDHSRDYIANMFQISKSGLNKSLISLEEIGAIELGGPRYGDTLTIKLIKENI